MDAQQLAAFRRMTESVNAGDAKAYASLYAEDAVITIFGGGQLEGRVAIEQYEVALLNEFPGTRLAFHSIWQNGAEAIVRYGVNGPAGSGRTMGHEGLLFYRFLPSGLIAEERRYLDTLTPMGQMGALGDTLVRLPPKLPEAPSVIAAASSAEQQNLAAVRASLAAFDAGNTERFLEQLGAGVVVDEMIDPTPVSGQEVRAWMDRWFRAASGARSEITSIVAIGDDVLVEAVLHATLAGPIGLVRASAAKVAVHRAWIFELREGKITRLTVFMNGKELAEAAGQWPPRMGK